MRRTRISWERRPQKLTTRLARLWGSLISQVHNHQIIEQSQKTGNMRFDTEMHARMPLMLTVKYDKAWRDVGPANDDLAGNATLPENNDMSWHPVSKMVNDPSNGVVNLAWSRTADRRRLDGAKAGSLSPMVRIFACVAEAQFAFHH